MGLRGSHCGETMTLAIERLAIIVSRTTLPEGSNMGRAEDLFERIQHQGVPAIEALIAERASEELFLEFKTSHDAGRGTHLHEHDRGHLRKAIGGFANSEGGVVIWGVECAKRTDDGDVAKSTSLLTNPTRFVSWLEGCVSGCTVPPVSGVRSISIPVRDNLGLVVTYVPKSPHAPHQIAGEGKYVIRAGSNFVPAPHGVVAGLFGKPPHPVVLPSIVIRPFEWTDDGYLQASARVVIVNNGQTVAEDLFATIHTPGAPTAGQGISIDTNIDWPMTSALEMDRSWVCPREFRLAPGGCVAVATVRLVIGKKAVADFRCNITVGCRGAIPDSSELFVSKDELDAELERIYSAKENPSAGRDAHRAAQVLLGLTAFS